MRYWLAILSLVLVGCSRSEAPPKELYNLLKNVRSLAFSPDGGLLVGGRNGGDLLIWDSGGEGSMREVKAHKGDVVSVAFVGSELFSAGYDGELKLWNTSDWTAIRTLESRRWLWTLRPHGARLAVLRAGGRQTYQPVNAEVEFWEDGRKSDVPFPVPGATDMAWSGSVLATAMNDSTLALWKPDGSQAHRLKLVATALDFSPDGQTLACGCADGVVRLLNPAGAETGALPALPKRITAVRYAPDGRLAYGCDERLVLSSNGQVVWDKPVDGYSSPTVLAFSPDGQRLASAGAARVLLWKL